LQYTTTPLYNNRLQKHTLGLHAADTAARKAGGIPLKTLQHTATHCNTTLQQHTLGFSAANTVKRETGGIPLKLLQHTATHCKKLKDHIATSHRNNAPWVSPQQTLQQERQGASHGKRLVSQTSWSLPTHHHLVAKKNMGHFNE